MLASKAQAINALAIARIMRFTMLRRKRCITPTLANVPPTVTKPSSLPNICFPTSRVNVEKVFR